MPTEVLQLDPNLVLGLAFRAHDAFKSHEPQPGAVDAPLAALSAVLRPLQKATPMEALPPQAPPPPQPPQPPPGTPPPVAPPSTPPAPP